MNAWCWESSQIAWETLADCFFRRKGTDVEVPEGEGQLPECRRCYGGPGAAESIFELTSLSNSLRSYEDG